MRGKKIKINISCLLTSVKHKWESFPYEFMQRCVYNKLSDIKQSGYQLSGSPMGSTAFRSKTSTSSNTVEAPAALLSSTAAPGDAELGWKYANGSSARGAEKHGRVGLEASYLQEKLSLRHAVAPCRHDNEVWRWGPTEQLFTAFALLRNCSFCFSNFRTSSWSFSTSSSALAILVLPLTSAILWGFSTSASIC